MYYSLICACVSVCVYVVYLCTCAQLRQEEARKGRPYSLQIGFFTQSGARLVASKPREILLAQTSTVTDLQVNTYLPF